MSRRHNQIQKVKFNITHICIYNIVIFTYYLHTVYNYVNFKAMYTKYLVVTIRLKAVLVPRGRARSEIPATRRDPNVAGSLPYILCILNLVHSESQQKLGTTLPSLPSLSLHHHTACGS